jgi:hypothetical protein
MVVYLSWGTLELKMNPYTVHLFKEAWAFLTYGNPSLLTLLSIANGLLLFAFITARARVRPADYPPIRSQLHTLMALVNVGIIMRGSIIDFVGQSYYRFQGLFDAII